MAFDAMDADIIYLGYDGSPVIRSNEVGGEWRAREYNYTELDGRHSILTHPNIGGVVLSGGSGLFVSKDYSETVHEIEKSSELRFIRDLWYDERTDILYGCR